MIIYTRELEDAVARELTVIMRTDADSAKGKTFTFFNVKRLIWSVLHPHRLWNQHDFFEFR
jgi:hypothetical protein